MRLINTDVNFVWDQNEYSGKKTGDPLLPWL